MTAQSAASATAQSFYALKALVNFLVRQGIALSDVFAVIGVKEETFNERDYTTEDYEALLQFGSQRLAIANIGFVHGKAFELSFWGFLGHIVAACPSLWQALGYQKRYQCLLGNTGRAYHEIEQQQVVIRWLSEPNASANNIEQVITSWVAFAFLYTHSDDKPLSVHFTHAPLAGSEQYQEFFGCPVYFNGDFNGIVFKQSSLLLPITSFNEEVLNVLCCHAENKLAAKRSSASLDIITQFIIETLPNKVPELGDIAEHLGIGVRQLQRKLQKEQTNLTQLLTDIRQSQAISYLTQTDHKLLYIAAKLGYSEQSAFQRAFKRWTGQTPQSYRLNPYPLR